MEKILVTRRNTGGRPSKLNDEVVDYIVRRYNCGETQAGLAEEYGVSRSTIQRVLRERRTEE